MKSGSETIDFTGAGLEGGINSHNTNPVACAKDDSVYFTASFTGNDTNNHGGLFRFAPGGLLQTAVRSDELPGPTPTFGEFTDLSVALNARCQYVLWGSNGLENGIWVSDPNWALVPVAQSGKELSTTVDKLDLLAIASGGNGFDGKPQAIDADGNVAFLATTDSGQALLAFKGELVPDAPPPGP